MIEEVGIYGGFAGTESNVSERTDYGYGEINETILSGDLIMMILSLVPEKVFQ